MERIVDDYRLPEPWNIGIERLPDPASIGVEYDGSTEFENVALAG